MPVLPRLALALLWGALLVLPLLAARWLRGPAERRLLRLFHRVVLRILGVRVRVEGAPLCAPVLLAGNHFSPLDIPVLSAAVPACFLAKRGVRSWPVVGAAAALQDTVFVERGGADVRQSLDALTGRLRAGLPVALFPEGGIVDGRASVPFRVGGLSCAAAAGVDVQPFALLVSRWRDRPTTAQTRRALVWGEESVFAHLAALLSGRPEITLRFGAPIPSAAFADRRALAVAVRAAVRGLLGEPH